MRMQSADKEEAFGCLLVAGEGGEEEEEEGVTKADKVCGAMILTFEKNS